MKQEKDGGKRENRKGRGRGRRTMNWRPKKNKKEGQKRTMKYG